MDAALSATAHHEAAHAVAHVVQGLPIFKVSIQPEGDANGVCAHPPPLMIDVPPGKRRSLARSMIVACYAGIEAERVLDPSADEDHGSADFSCAFELSREYGVLTRRVSYVGDDAHQAYLLRLRGEARGLVHRHWATIRRVARALLRRRELGAEEVVRLVGRE